MAKKVMVGMSGGVDSSVAVLVLKEMGYQVCGATLKLYDGTLPDDLTGIRTCCSLADVMDARSAASRLGVEHFVFNFTREFRKDVMQRFADSYAAGETPNPCIDCNRFIKFGKMLHRALLMEQDYIATGHYAQVEWDSDASRYLLKKPVDREKDQTYALYTMSQHELAHTLFPLGSLTKPQVRQLARAHNLSNANKPDSQDICFVPDGNYLRFLSEEMHVEALPGNFVDKDGTTLGRHQGIAGYTIGQRKGLGLSFDSPRYVVGKSPHTGEILLGSNEDLYQSSVRVSDLNWIGISHLTAPMEVTAKIRYRQQEEAALLHPLESGDVLIEFCHPQRAPAPGQAAVFYQDDIVIGGGTIQSA